MKKEIVLILILLLFAVSCTNQQVSNENNLVLEENVSDRILDEPQSNKSLAESIEEEKTEEIELSFEERYWNERIEAALELTNCPQVVERNLGNNYYRGPLIDTHIHIGSIPDGDPTEDFNDIEDDGMTPMLGVNSRVFDTICMLDHGNIDKAFVFFPVWDPIISQSIEVVNRSVGQYSERLIPFIMPPDDDGSPDGFPTVDAEALEEMLSIDPGLFKGYGEIGLYARGDHGGSRGAPALPPDSRRLFEIYPIIRNNNLIVYFHLGEGQKDSFERALKANPDINFIFHGDQLIPYRNGRQDLSLIADILENHPNAYYGIDELYGDVWLIRPEVTKEEFIEHFEDREELLEKDLETWKDFIEDHPDQVIWGTDRGAEVLWAIEPEISVIISDYGRYFIGHLDPLVQEKFAYKNAEKLINSSVI